MKLFRFSAKITAVLSVLLLGFLACTKEDEAGELTVEQAEKAIETTVEEFYACLKNVNDGGFSNFFYNALFITEKITTQETFYIEDAHGHVIGTSTHTSTENNSWLDLLEKKFSAQFASFNNGEGFNYHELKGTYTWKASSKEWVKSSNSSRIELKFPANKQTAANNAHLVLENYKDEEVAVSSEKKAKMPTQGKLLLTVDNKKMFEVVLSNVTYDKTTPFPMPLTAHIHIYAHPLTTTIHWKNKTPEVFNLTAAMTSSEGCKTTIEGDITLKNSTYANITSEKDFKKANLKITHNNLSVQVNADLEKLSTLEDKYTADQFNMYVKSEVFHKRSKIADLVYHKNAQGDFSPLLIFSDGSKKEAKEYVKDFDKRIEEIFKKFIEADEDED